MSRLATSSSSPRSSAPDRLYDVLGTHPGSERGRAQPGEAPVEAIGGARRLVVQREEDEVAAAALELAQAVRRELAVEPRRHAAIFGEPCGPACAQEAPGA